MAFAQVCKEGERKKHWIAWVTSFARRRFSLCSLLNAKGTLGALGGGRDLGGVGEGRAVACPQAAEKSRGGLCARMTGGSCASFVHPVASKSLS